MTIKLKNVRLSAYPALFTRPTFEGETQAKYGCKLLLDPNEHADQIEELKHAITALVNDKLDGQRLPSDKLCLRHGEDTGKAYHEGYWVLSVSTKNRPVVLDRRKNLVTEDDGVIYPGCRVNANVSLWAQKNKFGKRVNGELEGVQFSADDEPIEAGGGKSAKAIMEDFDALEERAGRGGAPGTGADADDMFAIA